MNSRMLEPDKDMELPSLSPTLDESKAYHATKSTCREGDVPILSIELISDGLYRILDRDLIMKVDKEYKVKCVGHWIDGKIGSLLDSDRELLESWSLSHLLEALGILMDLTGRYHFHKADLTREWILGLLLRLPQKEIILILNSFTFDQQAFIARYGLDEVSFSRYLALKDPSNSVSNAVVEFILDSLGLPKDPRPLFSLPEIVEEVSKKQPAIVIFVSLDKSFSILTGILWAIHETRPNAIVIGATVRNFRKRLFLDQPWFYLAQTLTHSKDAANVVQTGLASFILAQTKTTFLFLSDEGWMREATESLRGLGYTGHCLDSKPGFIFRFLDIFPGHLSEAGQRLKDAKDRIQTYPMLREEFPLIPDLPLVPDEPVILNIPEPTKMPDGPITISTNKCIALITSGNNRGKFCGREIPCKYHSATLLPQLAKLAKK